ncbi:MAG: hypothetical protein FJ102_20210 [Deltaproteobacteria bacterium]|nr:hypothetical protein [Deltaproteobacteria bacterium]
MLLLLACSAVTTLSELGPQQLSLALGNNGIYESPPTYDVYAVLEWELSGAIGGCAGLDTLTLSFADEEAVAVDLGGARGTACDHDASLSEVFDVSAWIDSPSETVALHDDSATVAATISYPAALRVLDPAEAVATPGGTTRFEWWPPSDVLPESLELRVEVVGGDSSAETVEVVDGGFDVAVPYTAASGVLRVRALLEEVEIAVTDTRGLQGAEVTGHLFHPAEGTVSVGAMAD